MGFIYSFLFQNWLDPKNILSLVTIPNSNFYLSLKMNKMNRKDTSGNLDKFKDEVNKLIVDLKSGKIAAEKDILTTLATIFNSNIPSKNLTVNQILRIEIASQNISKQQQHPLSRIKNTIKDIRNGIQDLIDTSNKKPIEDLQQILSDLFVKPEKPSSDNTSIQKKIDFGLRRLLEDYKRIEDQLPPESTVIEEQTEIYIDTQNLKSKITTNKQMLRYKQREHSFTNGEPLSDINVDKLEAVKNQIRNIKAGDIDLTWGDLHDKQELERGIYDIMTIVDELNFDDTQACSIIDDDNLLVLNRSRRSVSVNLADLSESQVHLNKSIQFDLIDDADLIDNTLLALPSVNSSVVLGIV